MWEYIYKSTKMPVVPMYGLFPVKLKTHIGKPIYPKEGMTPEDLRKLTMDAIEGMITQHQQLPGTLGQALVGRIDPEGRLSRSTSKNSLVEERISKSQSSSNLTQDKEASERINSSTDKLFVQEEGSIRRGKSEPNLLMPKGYSKPKFIITAPEEECEE